MLLIQNAYIKPITGPDIPGGCLLADGGRIAAIAPHIDPPEGCTVIDAGGRLLTPGCVEAHCHIGLDNECLRWEGMDYNEVVEPLTPQLRAIDSINPQDGAFPNGLRGGVTTACTGPGSANVVGGTFTVLKLAGKRVDNMLLKEPAAMKCAFGENPKGCYGHDKRQSPMTRMAVAALLRELLLRTLRYRDDKAAGKNPAFDMKLEAMLPVVNGEIPLKCHAHRADDILTAVRIAREFGLKLTLDHCTDGELIAELSKIEVKVSANREDVQLDIDVDSKMTGIKGEFTLTIKKAYTRYNKVLESWKKGVDLRSQIITKLADPDATNGQQERYSIDNCWYNDLPLVTYEKGGLIEEEATGGFTPSDMVNLDAISA